MRPDASGFQVVYTPGHTSTRRTYSLRVFTDAGIIGVMKIAHAAEGFGLDVELHGPGPVRRHLMAAMRNTNYYEMGLLHPKAAPFSGHLYASDYRDGINAIDENGCIEVPQGPGLGVEYDWDFITKHSTGVTVYK